MSKGCRAHDSCDHGELSHGENTKELSRVVAPPARRLNRWSGHSRVGLRLLFDALEAGDTVEGVLDFV